MACCGIQYPVYPKLLDLTNASCTTLCSFYVSVCVCVCYHKFVSGRNRNCSSLQAHRGKIHKHFSLIAQYKINPHRTPIFSPFPCLPIALHTCQFRLRTLNVALENMRSREISNKIPAFSCTKLIFNNKKTVLCACVRACVLAHRYVGG